MTESFLEEMRVQLDSRKKDVVELLASEFNAFQATNSNKGRDLVDLASNDFDKQILDVSSALEVKTLNKINAAITRMKNGHYGICAQCGHTIAQDRLKAMPYAVLCVKCKTQRERFIKD
ncbi:TraR/DksA family transcriptional regulator [Thiospirochaeta perfilievii]|nr:TraR/DksA family transcriptional regulator [Thiospirochaeta perfilievii]